MIAFIDASNLPPIGPALVTSVGAVIVALIAGAVALRSNSKANSNTADIQAYKSATDRDLERLKAKLEHGQLVSSTQWNVEFNAYQTVWKAIVSVRSCASDVATYESALQQLDLLDVMSSKSRLDGLTARTKCLDAALTEFSSAIQNNAPFYPSNIRTTAVVVLDELRSFAMGMMAYVFAHINGAKWEEEQVLLWSSERNKELLTAFTGIEHVDAAIRERLDKVRLID